jgi:peptidoglycan/xylan/chitin deacetylase (PgdA/CDA1 family)
VPQEPLDWTFPFVTRRTTPRSRLVAVLAVVATMVLAASCSGSEPGQAAPLDGSELVPTIATLQTTTTTAPTTTTTTAPPPTTVPGAMAIPSSENGAPLVQKVHTTEPVIFVTIDDGNFPSPEGLQYLRETGMPISMFLNRRPVEAHPGYFQELIALGNWVHTHTLDHPRLTGLDAEGQTGQICGMLDVLTATYGPTGHVGRFLRAPYGMTDDATGPAAASCGLDAIVGWSGEVRDGSLSLVNPHLYPGDVILLHFTPNLQADLATAKDAADAAGFRIARLEDYLVEAPATPPSTMVPPTTAPSAAAPSPTASQAPPVAPAPPPPPVPTH